MEIKKSLHDLLIQQTSLKTIIEMLPLFEEIKNDFIEGMVPLQRALLFARNDIIELILKQSQIENYGDIPLGFLALARGRKKEFAEKAIQCFKLLIKTGVDFRENDRAGRSLVEVGIEMGADPKLLEFMLELPGCRKSAPTLFSIALRFNDVEIMAVLLKYFSISSKEISNLINQAIDWRAWECLSSLLKFPEFSTEISVDLEKLKIEKGIPKKTLIASDIDCYQHIPLPKYPHSSRVEKINERLENDERLEVLLEKDSGILLSRNLNIEIKFYNRSVKEEDILRIHSFLYLEKLSGFCSSLSDSKAIKSFDRDTFLCKESLRIAFRAAGVVLEAIDQVFSGYYSNAFCIIRPPGHHAGINGEVESVYDKEETTVGY